MSRILAPIAVYVYNRAAHFKQCIAALQDNSLAEQSEVYIVSDGAKCEEHKAAVDEVRSHARNIKGFKKVHLMFREENLGIFESASSADRQILTEHGKMISVEDDDIVAPSFLKFINEGLDFYEHNKKIFSISGYLHPIPVVNKTGNSAWFSYWSYSWGYGIWKDRYFEMDLSKNRLNEIKSDKELYKRFVKYGAFTLELAEADLAGRMVAGDVRIAIEMLLRGMYTVMPYVSKVQNIGFDGSGYHCGISDRFKVEVSTIRDEEYLFPEDVCVDHELMATINRFINVPNYRKTKQILKWLGIHDSVRHIYRKMHR
jgi:hypothetical protein